jgi:geranylgeranyl transferase type-2 subunit beta
LLSEDASVLLPPQKFLQSKKNSLASVVDCFSFLNAHRMLKHPIEHLDDIRAVLQRYLLPQGGFSRTPGENGVSAYQTFLGSLCLEMLGEEMPNKKEAAIAIEQLKRPAGGYTEFAGQTEPQTSATAAAVAVLMLHGELNEERGADAIRFLLNSQCRDGGLAAHASLEIGDLLSTFTGSLTLAGLNAIDSLDLANLAEFLRQTSSPDGGFTACTADTVPDVEYTYYGLATYSLLRQVG